MGWVVRAPLRSAKSILQLNKIIIIPAFLLALLSLSCSDHGDPIRIYLDDSTVHVIQGRGVPVPDALPSEPEAKLYHSFPVDPARHFETPNALADFTIYIPFEVEPNVLDELDSPAIYFPGLGENYIIHLNGHEIAREIHVKGGQIQTRRTELAFPLSIRRDYLKPGQNLLTLYLLGEVSPESGAVPGLFYNDGYYLGKAEDVYRNTLDLSNIILVSLYLAFGVYFLFLFLRRHEELYGLFFFLFTLGTFGFYIFRSRLAYDLVENTESLTRWENASIFMLPGVLMLFLVTYLRHKERIPIWAHAIGGINILCSILVLVIPFSLVPFLVDKWRMLQGPMMLWLPVFHIWSMRRGDRDAGKFTMALVLLLSAAGFDFFNSIYVFVSMEPAFRWGFFGYAFLLVVTMANRFLLSLKVSEELNVQLDRAKQELEEAARMRDTFSAAASHEIRTPVHGIMGISRILLQESREGEQPLSPYVRQSLELIQESSRRLARLVDDFADHSRLKEGQLKITPTAVRLHSVARYSISALESQVRQKSVEILNLVDPDLPPVLADELRLQQILLNLIGNSIKFTRQGSVSVRAVQDDSHIEISVQDTGIGIPEDRREMIFQPFHQADEAIARSYGGAGLGLYIVRRLVELHEGTLDLESRPGHGSTFKIRLKVAPPDLTDGLDEPLEKLEQESPPAGHSRALQDFRLLQEVTRESASVFGVKEQKPTVLVVDDDTINSAVLRGILEPAGFEVQRFQSAREAIQYLQSEGPSDVAILDLMLGGMSGIELCIWIRQNYSSMDLPVLILTAYGDNDRMVEGFAAGANDYLERPVDAVELLARIRTLVDLKFASRERAELLGYRQELQIARKIHRELLPTAMPELAGLRSVVRYLPRGDLGGDFYDVRAVQNGGVALLADVTGHGIAAALGAAITRVAFLLQNPHWTLPADVLQGMNRILLDAGTSQLVTGICAHLDSHNDTLSLARAGHLPAALLRKDGELEILFPRGRVMGWLQELNCELVEMPFQSGDRLVMITDGLTELRNHGQEFLGEERVWGFFRDRPEQSAEELSDGVMELIRQWQPEPQDDIAVLIVERVSGTA